MRNPSGRHDMLGHNKFGCESRDLLGLVIHSVHRNLSSPMTKPLHRHHPGDLVLDSFAGSGTTGAVAHKMGRRWIMVELGEHCHTTSFPPEKVIDGETRAGDAGGGWQGGGGFRYIPPGPTLLATDRWGNWVINPGIQRRHAVGGHVQAGGLHLRAQRRALWWQHGQQRAGLHLCDHPDPGPSSSTRWPRRWGQSAPCWCCCGRLPGGRWRRLAQPHGEEDPEDGVPLRVGP